MKICVFASSSNGNCLLLSDGGTNILLDAGISMRRIVSSLEQLGLTMRDIGGVLITHEHSDHISGLKILVKHYSFPIFAPSRVACRIGVLFPDAADRIKVIPVGQEFHMGCLGIKAFHTCHDAQESVGYRFSGSGSFAVATDTGIVTDEILEGLKGADAVLIESNHDEQMLCDGPYPFYLKRRILSDKGHLSNESCASLAGVLAESGTKTIVLGHLSCTNNTPSIALNTTEQALCGYKIAIHCAPKFGLLEIDI